ncbi:MAG: bifunctional aspartate transaminase/aspartate 4-decarboxylase [Candidatus Abyssubacteria bacterium]|nr:bifunctional aspartate transaminase/aspartate 4-decarboxylase [Candidatus Abyssubacteria bacterium]
MSPIKRISVSRAREKELEVLSPFELKNNLIQLADENMRKSAAQMLNAGRGNPNWVCTTPREAFFTLGRFGIEESKRVLDVPDTGGMPQKPGIAKRFNKFLEQNADAPGANLLRAGVDYAVKKLGMDPDSFVHELTDSIVGDHYPMPDRMLSCTERIVHEYLIQEMCASLRPRGKYDLFAVEGGTAAMCYIFDSLMVNRLLHRGDTIALGVPTFTPYIEIPRLDRFSFRVVEISANKEMRPDGTHAWQYADSEIDKLADRRIKAFFVVNPSNPPSYAIRASSMRRIVKLVKTKRPDLIIITDDVYGTFVPGFRSLMAELPQNTIGVYSFSKHFGCTGWRLGVVAIHEKNIFDQAIAKLPAKDRAALKKRYSNLTLTPEKMKFIDRMVADSRLVALNHTAGLSLPQQIQMLLFALFALTDTAYSYKTICQLIVRRRFKALWDGLGLSFPADKNRADYYCELDLMIWAEQKFGPDFARFLKKNFEPVDVLFRLAELSGVVLMPGGGFEGPQWSVRVSLANLPEAAYPEIGKHLVEAAKEYIEAWKESKKK